MAEVKQALCTMCDMHCMIQGEVEDGEIKKLSGLPWHPLAPNTFCIKPYHALEYYNHKDRLLYPLKRKGDRGSGEWDRISWDQAYDEIAQKLKIIVEKYGPEAFAVSTSEPNAFQDVWMFGDVVDKLYKLKHPYSALISARHRMSICLTVLLFPLTTRHIR
jgi:anaerobic selenocysteine-containing dehydrogenase